MTSKSFLLFTCLLFSGVTLSQDFPQRYASLGTLYLPAFSSSPFPHADRTAGHTYGGKHYPADIHYSDSTVALFVPKGFRRSSTVDLVLYLHGWYNNIDSACAQFSLIEQFVESNKNALFIFPEGPKNAPDSFGGRVEEKDGLKNIVQDVLRYALRQGIIDRVVPGKIILAGHSGAYRAIAFMLMRGGLTENISDVLLFDALYGQTEKYAYWIDHFHGRFINIYTDSGGTKNESLSLKADLDGWGIPARHCDESELTDEMLAQTKNLFIHSDLSHNEVIAERKQFKRFLETSVLQSKQ